MPDSKENCPPLGRVTLFSRLGKGYGDLREECPMGQNLKVQVQAPPLGRTASMGYAWGALVRSRDLGAGTAAILESLPNEVT